MKVYSSLVRYQSKEIIKIDLNIDLLSSAKRDCLKRGGLIGCDNVWYCLEITPFNQLKPAKRKKKRLVKQVETFFEMIDRKTNNLLLQIKENKKV